MKKKKGYGLFRVIRWLVQVFYKKIEIEGQENLPQEPCVIVGNHTQMNGPIACELYMPDNHFTWCAGEMMELKKVPAYAYSDFWSQKPKAVRWFYKLLSYIIAPISVAVFNNARTIAVHHDIKIMNTFKETTEKLQHGNNVVIFPEHDVPHNQIISDFQTRFVDVAKMYYRKTGKELNFVPLYIAPKLSKMYYGRPVKFNAEAPIEDERIRICSCLMEEITCIAVSLPKHTVIPYRNIPKKEYKTNI